MYTYSAKLCDITVRKVFQHIRDSQRVSDIINRDKEEQKAKKNWHLRGMRSPTGKKIYR